MSEFAFLQWKNYDNLYDVKKLKELIKESRDKYKLNNVYKIKEDDGIRYPAILLKIGNVSVYKLNLNNLSISRLLSFIGTQQECEKMMETITSYNQNVESNREINKKRKENNEDLDSNFFLIIFVHHLH